MLINVNCQFFGKYYEWVKFWDKKERVIANRTKPLRRGTPRTYSKGSDKAPGARPGFHLGGKDSEHTTRLNNEVVQPHREMRLYRKTGEDPQCLSRCRVLCEETDGRSQGGERWVVTSWTNSWWVLRAGWGLNKVSEGTSRSRRKVDKTDTQQQAYTPKKHQYWAYNNWCA